MSKDRQWLIESLKRRAEEILDPDGSVNADSLILAEAAAEIESLEREVRSEKEKALKLSQTVLGLTQRLREAAAVIESLITK